MSNRYWSLVALFYIAIIQVLPLTILWYFATPDFQNQTIFNFHFILWTPLGITIISICGAILLVYFNVIRLKGMNFVISIPVLYSLVIVLSLTPLSVFWRMFISFSTVILVTILTSLVISRVGTFKNKKCKKLSI
ncbi:hypothetical protein MCAL160_0594 [Mycoplasmopsis californica HAZ160_1]|uniref:Integral membrane protein n=1 Tax=Mycoplasmopsis californica HAZ160_1 TaxID=1397850 RepID=A0AAT9F895_9BACT|nr:hypothetical protein MCAL160_0594 [Mycoplasmopsis californica HAZ160_1]BBG40969.1 hypothetical protein MCAL106_0594 [Mycoplasmopsis californica]BBG41562.1 hypothetical protein MCAL106E_0594 [Mycoplasmopsis californica]BBG42156.1 hypothetical protein MCAL106L_0594 [Mycoplasmopsis californica]BBG42738.1 hypothetical protein MCAL160E_0594 [Mycoplasmopsis californica]